MNKQNLSIRHFPRAVVLSLNNDNKISYVVASELVNYKLGVATNLQEYIKMIFNNIYKHYIPTNKNLLYVLLCQITTSMQLALYQLHTNRILHLDIALRNYLLSYKTNDFIFNCMITDFGFSRRIPVDNEKVKMSFKRFTKLNFPLMVMNKSSIKAHISSKNDPVETREFSIISDLFAFKIAIFELLGLMLNKTLNQIIDLIQGATLAVNLKERLKISDGEALAKFINNILGYKEDCAFDDIKEVITNFIECFSAYLCYTQDENVSWNTAVENDKEKFNEARLQFLQKFNDKQLDFLEDFQFIIPDFLPTQAFKSEQVTGQAATLTQSTTESTSSSTSSALVPSSKSSYGIINETILVNVINSDILTTSPADNSLTSQSASNVIATSDEQAEEDQQVGRKRPLTNVTSTEEEGNASKKLNTDFVNPKPGR